MSCCRDCADCRDARDGRPSGAERDGRRDQRRGPRHIGQRVRRTDALPDRDAHPNRRGQAQSTVIANAGGEPRRFAAAVRLNLSGYFLTAFPFGGQLDKRVPRCAAVRGRLRMVVRCDVAVVMMRFRGRVSLFVATEAAGQRNPDLGAVAEPRTTAIASRFHWAKPSKVGPAYVCFHRKQTLG